MSFEPAEDEEELETDDEENEREKNKLSDKTINNQNPSTNHHFSNLKGYKQHCSDGLETMGIPYNIQEKILTADPKNDQNSIKSNKWIWIVIALSAAVLVSLHIKYIPEAAEKERRMADCSAFLNMHQFKNQDKILWKSLKSGIEGTFNSSIKPQPSIFALFSNDKDTMDNIMREIIDITKKCIDSTKEPINLSKNDLSSNELQEDHTKLILKFKSELEEREIMIINDIDKVPITVIPSLHSFCDTINPLVAKSIIFITIHVPQVPPGKVSFFNSELSKENNNNSVCFRKTC